jgi:hypothetical protein
MRLVYSEIVLRVFGKINSSSLTSSMPPCLRVSSPMINVCSHLPFQVRYTFPITNFIYMRRTLPHSQSLKSTQRVARNQTTTASKCVASTRPWYCRLPLYSNTIALKQRSSSPSHSLASFHPNLPKPTPPLIPPNPIPNVHTLPSIIGTKSMTLVTQNISLVFIYNSRLR